MAERSPEVEQIFREMPILNQLIGPATPHLSTLKVEAEREFTQKYGETHGSFDDFLRKYVAVDLPDEPVCPVVGGSVKLVSSPQIVSHAKLNRKFDIFEFLTKDIIEKRAIVLTLVERQKEEEEDQDEDDDEEDEQRPVHRSCNDEEEFEDDTGEIDLSLAEIANVALTLNQSQELKYKILEVHGQKKPVHEISMVGGRKLERPVHERRERFI